MPEIGGVWYGDHAYEHMAQIAQETLDGRDPELVNEAAVIHAFHEEFPGVVMKEADDDATTEMHGLHEARGQAGLSSP